MREIFWLTLRQVASRGRLVVLLVLATLPVLIAVMSVGSTHAPTVQGFEDGVLGTMLAGSISPLVVLAIASAAFGNEIEDRTLSNLTLAPIPRWQIVVPKLLAAACLAGPFMVVSAFITGYVAFSGDTTAAIAIAAGVLVGVALYASGFLWLGLKTTRAIGYGLLYIVLWEGFFSGFVSGVRYFSVRYYSIAWMRGIDARRFVETDDLSFVFAVVASLLVFGGFLFLSIRRLRRMDIP